MAKLGETDPRWIVTERTDGTNVNNWHWTEKNCLPWAKERMPQLFEGVHFIENGEDQVKLTKVDTLSGECHINTRKGKIFHFYELELRVKWAGTLSGEQVEGNFDMPEISFENEIDEHEIRVNVTQAKDKSVVKQIIQAQGVPKVRSILDNFLDEFKAMRGYLQEVKEVNPLSSPEAAESVTAANGHVPAAPPPTSIATATTTSAKKSAGPCTTKIELRDKFAARPSDIFEALVDPRRVEAYTQSSVQIDLREGGKFSLFGGNITGEYLQIQANQRIVQQWRTSSWPEGLYSTVTIELTQGRNGCDMKLVQENVPDAEAERTQQAWRENIFERIKRLFGYGMGYSPF